MISIIDSYLKDNGGRRSGIDRRYFLYSNHIPERRRGAERRASTDRRSGSDRREDGYAHSANREMRVALMDRRTNWKPATV